ncbi:Lrp/AsnC family transcriptional regulator [Candidatus Micrarchaeota archaeon]|nr:Lrp/AsnC family transcriptional regulator [Candidatus Micrarchaeota archaeon]
MKELDRKDYLLLDILGEGSRRGAGRLAKELRLHKNSVSYRVKRLRRLGVIRNFSFIPGFVVLGKNTYYVFFRFRGGKDANAGALQYLKNHPLAMWVLRLAGKWSCMAELICDDINHFNDELAKITKELGDVVADYRTSLLYIPYKVESSINFEKEYAAPPFAVSVKGYAPDETDRTLLGLLSDDSSLPYDRLAEKASISSDAAFYRVKKMVAAGLIRKFVPIVDLEKLGFQRYIVSLKLSNISEEKFSSLKQALAADRSISFAFRSAGELGVIIFCAFRSNAGLDSLLASLDAGFGDSIREHEVLIISEVVSFSYFPAGLRA